MVQVPQRTGRFQILTGSHSGYETSRGPVLPPEYRASAILRHSTALNYLRRRGS